MIEDKDYGAPIPDILIKLKYELLANNGHFLEGIFRIDPIITECIEIEEEINKDNMDNFDFTKID